MLRQSSSIYILVLSLLDTSIGANGVRIQAWGRSIRPPLSFGMEGSLNKRAQVSTSLGVTGVSDSMDTLYTAPVTFNGVDVDLQIDTGSSDLWTNYSVPNAQLSQIPANITYGLGSAAGFIGMATVEFAGYAVNDQAFIAAQDVEQMQIPGIIGLGPPQGSVVDAELWQAFNDSRGDPFVNRVFAQNASTPNFISFVLGRTETPNAPFQSEFTIGEIISGLNAVTSYPQMPVQLVNPQEISGQHWTLQVDAIIGPDGQEIPVKSGVPNSNKLVAVLDTGFSFPPVPQAVSDAFYGRVQGAQFSQDDGIWIVPCEQELNVAFVIGGVTYNIHPLDAVQIAGTYSNGAPLCVGPFQPNPLDFGSDIFDMILGDAFLRNTYTYINYGDFEDENMTSTAAPYIQLLNMTNPDQAHQEFVKARMNGVDHTKDAQYQLLPPNQGQASGSDSNLANYNSIHSIHPTIRTSGISTVAKIIIIAVGAGVLLSLAVALFFITRCLRRSRARRLQTFGFKGVETSQPYYPLNVPAPQAHPTAHDPKSFGYYGSGTY